MGNCLNHLFVPPPAKKGKLVVHNEGEKEFRDSKVVKEVHYFLPPAGCIMPNHHPISLKIIKKESCKGGRSSIKIMVSRQQLEFLLRHAKMFQSMKVSIPPTSRTPKPGNQKWRPSLSAIPEEPYF
uniref:Uncharacterized protein n=1 Tax=Gossypium raimondii TaxID=29730 RepID=A0A0D2S3P5_GOSRA|nr:hypothetical protein B456_009G184300 [Gossypium raimondii]